MKSFLLLQWKEYSKLWSDMDVTSVMKLFGVTHVGYACGMIGYLLV
jgi:hypothetical protein